MLRFLIYLSVIALLVMLNLLSGSTGWLDIFADLDAMQHSILYQVRLPSLLTALLAGAALSLSGLLMQVYFDNPLAGPGVLGVSSGAGLAVSLSLLAGLGAGWALPLVAAMGAMLVLGVIAAAAVRLRSAASLLILGLMIGYIASAAVSLLQYTAEADRLQRFVYWSMGSFQSASKGDLLIMAPIVIIGIAAAGLLHRRLDLLLLGNAHLQGLGSNSKGLRVAVLALSGLLSGIITAYCGPLAFLGLAAPHLARMLNSSDVHARMIPDTICVGIIIALSALLVVQAPLAGGRLPLNAVLSLFGAPVVVWLLVDRSQSRYFS